MISERKLASSHSSFWRNVIPMGDSFVRQMNRTLTRIVPPCPSAFKGIRNSLISELSFRLYLNYCINPGDYQNFLKDSVAVNQIADDVCQYIARLERSEVVIDRMALDEISESIRLSENLKNSILHSNPGKEVLTRPKFTGCGIVDDCEGDLLVGTTLYELKNVDRDFRLTDVRQLLVYCALNSESREHNIDTIGLLNSRTGLYYKIDINEVSYAIAGVGPNEIFSDIVRYITADAPSK